MVIKNVISFLQKIEQVKELLKTFDVDEQAKLKELVEVLNFDNVKSFNYVVFQSKKRLKL